MARTKWLIKRHRTVISLIIGLVFGFILGLCITSVRSNAKVIKEYLGEWYVSTYSPSDSSQNGHGTASGKRATQGRTVAVDMHNPLVPMGTHLYIEGVGDRVVEDVGGFGKYNNGRRALDVFVESSADGFLKLCKVYTWREETKEEKAERIAKQKEKERKQRIKRREKYPPNFVYDETLSDWQMVTDPEYISGGAVIINYHIYDVVDTEKGLKNTVKVGNNMLAAFYDGKPFTDVIEEAVG